MTVSIVAYIVIKFGGCLLELTIVASICQQMPIVGKGYGNQGN
jgi:hypothetical protein